MSIVDRAMMIALRQHAGTVNKHDGELYLLHVARVVTNVRERGGSDVQLAIAWLHDVIEDTAMSLSALRRELSEVPPVYTPKAVVDTVIAGVDAMTKRKGETLVDYYERVKANDDARFVKFNGDMLDNFRRNHLIVDDATRLRMAAKYSLGMDVLGCSS